MSARLHLAIVGVLSVIALSACATTGPNDGLGASPSGSASASPSAGAGSPSSGSNSPTPPNASPQPLQPIFVQKTGGIAGIRVFLSIAADGSWQFGEGEGQAKSGQQQTGKLSASQKHELELRLADPRIHTEQLHPVKVGVCADTFMYMIAVGNSKWVLDDCYKATNPGTYGVISFLSQVTPL